MNLLADLKSYIVSNGLRAGDVFLDAMPDRLSKTVALYEYEGHSPFPQIAGVTRPIQVVVKDLRPNTAYQLALDIYKMLLTEDGILDITDTRWSAINLRQTPFKMKTDEAGYVYYCFNVDVTTTIE